MSGAGLVTWRCRHLGLTLIEAVVVLAIATFVVIGAIVFFQSAQSNGRISELVGEVAAVQQAVRTAYAGQSDFSGLNAQALVKSLPADMVRGSGSWTRLQHAFSGAIDVSPISLGSGTALNGFSIRMDGLPAEACAKLAIVDFGSALFTMDVTSGTAFATGLSKPMRPGAAGALCSNSSTSSIIWRFY